MTAQQQENTAAAIATVRAQMGLTNRPPAEWSYEERNAYNKALSAYMLARPNLFSGTQLAAASQVESTVYEPLETYSIMEMLEDFGKEATARAAKMADVGSKSALLIGLVVCAFLALKHDPRHWR